MSCLSLRGGLDWILGRIYLQGVVITHWKWESPHYWRHLRESRCGAEGRGSVMGLVGPG